MALKKFYFTFTLQQTVELDVSKIFTDGQSWRGRTLEDVKQIVKREGGASRIYRDWQMDWDAEPPERVRLRITERRPKPQRKIERRR